jgi:flagellar basal-body rod protein FlgB
MQMTEIAMFGRTVGLLKKVLDLRVQNQQVIASNIANADTPGYAPARLEFEKDLQRALGDPGSSVRAGHPNHLPPGGGGVDRVEGRVIRSPDASGIGDRNGVEVDQEMIALAENQIMYEAATQMLSKKLGLLKYVIQDGR